MRSCGVIAVDLGGTWMRAAAVSDDDAMGPVVVFPTRRERPPDEILHDLAGVIEAARAGLEECRGLSLGIPTVLDREGRLAVSDNLPTMTGLPLADAISGRIGSPVRIHNDANCFAAGEWWKGAGVGTGTLCGVTLGTGIGVGLVLDGRLHAGNRGEAGEIWRSPFLDGRTVEEWTRGAFLGEAYGEKIDGAEVARRAAANDTRALDAFAAYGRVLGTVLAFVVNLVDPDALVLGGSVAKSFALFRGDLLETLETGTGRPIDVRPSALGETAALWGAVRLFRDGEQTTWI